MYMTSVEIPVKPDIKLINSTGNYMSLANAIKPIAFQEDLTLRIFMSIYYKCQK